MQLGHLVVGEACQRFFEIDELVALFIELAPWRVLINCQRVCTLWQSIIKQSPIIQQKLFLQPSALDAQPSPNNYEDEDEGPSDTDSEVSDSQGSGPQASEPPLSEPQIALEDSVTPSRSAQQAETFVLNPVLAQFFAPILASPDPSNSTWCSYDQLYTLLWAETGTELHSPARQAFAREEASWRHMLVCQPPIFRLDWWHEWATADNHWYADGHQDYGRNCDQPITLGLLWDLSESRLRRGCTTRVLYFPNGKSPDNDPTATEEERQWAHDSTSQHHGFTSEIPRVKLMTRQRWDQLPRACEHYDMGTNRWEASTMESGDRDWRHYEADGFNALRQDCHRDHDTERWSRSEGFQWAEIHGESSSGARHDPTGTDRWAS